MSAQPTERVSARPSGRMAALRRVWRTIDRLHNELFITKYRSALQREARVQEDAFLAMLYLSAFGIDDPAAYHTLPITGELVDGYHAWHVRQGLDRFPDFGVCC